MQGETIEIRVSPYVFTELQSIADTEQISVSDVARMAIYRDISKPSGALMYPEPDWPDLGSELRRARNWLEIRSCLLQRGYLVERHGSKLSLRSARSQRRYAWPSDPDLTHSALTVRFGAPMAGTPKALSKF